MEELKILLQKILNKDLQQIILSNSRHPEQTQKVKIRPVLIREELLFQETAYRGTQVFHENFTAEQLTDRICTALQEQFRQGEFSAKTLQATALVLSLIHISTEEKLVKALNDFKVEFLK